MPFRSSRGDCSRGRPPGLAAETCRSIFAHWASVRSEVYGLRFTGRMVGVPTTQSPSPFQTASKMADLHDAARSGDLDRLRDLLAAGAKLEARDKRRRTPLMVAAEAGQEEAVR